MKLFRCRDVSPMYCPFEYRGESAQAILEKIREHGKAEHGLTDETILPAMVAMWTAKIHDEADPAR